MVYITHGKINKYIISEIIIIIVACSDYKTPSKNTVTLKVIFYYDTNLIIS